jgi:hypothetical protein
MCAYEDAGIERDKRYVMISKLIIIIIKINKE